MLTVFDAAQVVVKASKHAPAKYYFRLAAIDHGGCDRGGWLRNGPGTVCGRERGISRLTSGGQMIPSRSMTEETKAPTAPEISSGLWINSEPLTLKSLHGRVVLIEFWTFACYNCRNTLPSLKKWDAQYRDKGLTIIGVHTPELDFERDIDQLRREVAGLGIKYPVVTDQDYSTWKAYSVEAWPTLFLLDKQGRVRWTHVGEGYYDETEQVIKKLLAEESGETPVNR